MKKQSLFKGALILGAAGTFAKFLGIFFRIPLIYLLGDEGVGYYQLSYPLYMFFVAALSGVPLAISKLISERVALKDYKGSIQILKKALLLMVMLGGGFSLFLLLFSKNLLHLFKWDEKSYYPLLGISLAPFFVSIMSVFRGYFQGMHYMTPSGISQVIEQVGRIFVGIGLCFLLLPKGMEFAAGGAALGAAGGGILGGIYLIHKYFKNRDKNITLVKEKDYKILSEIIKISIPISLGATVSTIMSLIDSILVPMKLIEGGYDYSRATILYGQLTGKASVIVNVPLTLSIAICASLVPIIAESYVLKKKNEVVGRINSSLKMSMAIALPCTLGIYFMAYPIVNLLFPGNGEGYEILKISAISLPFIVLTQTSTAILQSTGKYITPIINLLIGCIFKIVITYILVPNLKFNIYGAVIGTIIGYIIASVLNIISLKDHIKFKVGWYDSLIKPAFCSVIMIIIVVLTYYYAYNKIGNSSLVTLLSILLGGGAYIILLFVSGIFEYNYFVNKLIKR